MTVIAHTETLMREQTVEFEVVAFDEGKWKKEANTTWTRYKPTNQGFILYDLILGKEFYPQVEFKWSNGSQKFEIIGIK